MNKVKMASVAAVTGSLAALAIASSFIAPDRVEANVGFARKTGLSCASCHSDAADPRKEALTSVGNSYRTCLYNPTASSIDCNVQAQNQTRAAVLTPAPSSVYNNTPGFNNPPVYSSNPGTNSTGGFGGSKGATSTYNAAPAPPPVQQSKSNGVRDFLLGLLGASVGNNANPGNNGSRNPGYVQPTGNNPLDRIFIPPQNFDIGQQWAVSEQLGGGRKLDSVWAKRTGSNIFDAVYIDSQTNAQTNDIVTYNGIRNGQVSFRRQSTGTIYTGKMTTDGRMVLGGTTNQRAGNLTWSGSNVSQFSGVASAPTGGPLLVPAGRSGGMDFLLFDVASDRTDPGFPKAVDSNSFPGVWPQGATAVYNGGNDKAYFFRGNEYIRYDINADRADPGYPQTINNQTWPGLWTNGIDAAVNGGGGKVFFFRSGQFMRYDIAADRVDPGYPQPVDNRTWPGLQALGRIESAVNAGNGKIYFFSGNRYLRYDVAANRADPGYPQLINAQTWPGVWPNNITMAASGPGKLLLFRSR
ncbi:hemopexin repeat-containing protein [Parasphingorhabdus sp.]|uniref:hemopexin repeat-containing protein n=1 Tax=Parasphingorhabdus sp. TaxID=2709688 RepID=UPI003002BA89